MATFNINVLTRSDSLVSSQVYEIVKTIYDTTSDATPNPISTESLDSAPRIKVLQSTLGQLRLNNIATLDAITTHFTRLIDLTSADEEYSANLAQTLASCILRPRQVNSLTMEERHAYRLVRDLFDHKEAIFGELKRQASSGGGTINSTQRARQNSAADESSRRANMEARARAINEERQRAKSPSPRHRRDKSTDGGMGRFPVVASPRPDRSSDVRNTTGVTPMKRASLEVPGSAGSTPVNTRPTDQASSIPETGLSDNADQHQPQQQHSSGTPNGQSTPTQDPDTMMSATFMPGGGGPGPHIPPPMDDDDGTITPTSASATSHVTESKSQIGSLKRNNLGSGRRGGRYATGAGSLKSQSSLGLEAEKENSGVQLQDRAMDEDFS